MTGQLFAQNATVRGRITSRDSALAGVTVQVKGTNTTTQTDDNGNFSINAPTNGTLVFSSVGYLTSEVRINNQTQITLSLEPSVGNMNEVVVVGYGTQRRGSVTGAVSSIKSSDLTRTPATTTSGALVGRTQGVTARATDSRPGGSVNLQIRNMGAPLFIIDGVPSDAGQFNNLGIDDIDNISILKDASAAIYGLRAANGVVLVTTKKGKSGGKPDINVSGYYGLQNFTNFPKPPDAATYMRGLAYSNQNRGIANPASITPEELAKWDAGTEKGYQSYDYYKEIMRPNVPQHYINASASGGSQNSKYYFSVSNVDQDALMKDFSFQRTNMQANLEAGLAKGLKIGTQISGRYEKRRQAGVPGLDDYFNPMLSIFTMWPTERPYANDNPRYVNGDVHNINVNPATYNMDVTGYTRDDWRAIKPIFTAQYDLPFGLSLKGTYSYNYTTQMLEEFEYTYDAYSYNPTTDQYNVVGGNQNPWRRKRSQHIQENFAQLQLNYNKQIGDHSIAAVAAYEKYDVKSEWLETGSLPQNNTVAIVYFQDQNRLDQRYSEAARAGYIGRINYGYKQKYLIEALGRYDGSYLYAKDRRFGLFPGVTVGWRLSQEEFMKNVTGNVLSDLKIRAGYGETGSEIGFANGDGPTPFGYLQGYDYASGSAVLNGTLVTGVRPRGLPVTMLTWVTNISRNVGVDFALFKNKLSGTVDVFERRRTGLPAQRNDILLPVEVGYGYPNENLESDAIRGIEGILTYSNNTDYGLSYSLSANATVARLKVLGRYKPRVGNSWDEYRNTAVSEDRWASVNFGYQVVGRFQSQAEIDNHPVNNDGQGNRTQLPGDFIYADVNGDKIINGLDERPIGYAEGATPYMSFGFNSTFGYKGFNLNIDLAGATMQSYRREFEMQIPFQNNGAGVGYLISDAWRRQDPFDANSAWIPGTYPAVRKDFPGHVNNRKNDFWVVNVSYIRVRNAQLGYTVPNKYLDRFGIRGLRFYVQGTNLLKFDNVDQYEIDPEISSTNGLVYPQQRLYTFGFNLNL
ncbi:SusC/RagA family TonB-linked outer membrane protein [Pseudocnuella soli]|uniref:SusC/RagA family TonB-linked outer membrane protein n=1 Tax=Pseudocnuella soli TaxID=2502779 RepID=UPI001F02C75C|nr:TonB-dependent receptor [Pseudocnuella soli]